MVGPAVATFLAIFIIQLLQLMMTTKVAEVKFSEVFPWKNIAVILSINALLACVFWVLKRFLPLDNAIGNIGESLVLGTIWAGGYFLFMKRRALTAWKKLNQESNDSE